MKLKITQRQAFDAQRAVDTAAMNGVIALVMLMCQRQLISAEEVRHIHTSMIKPLNSNENAGNPIVQNTLQHLDEQFAAILKLN